MLYRLFYIFSLLIISNISLADKDHINLLIYGDSISAGYGMDTEKQWSEELQKILNTDNVACVIDAKHLCVNSRGIGDTGCSTITSEFGGVFKSPTKKQEFLEYIQLSTDFNDKS